MFLHINRCKYGINHLAWFFANVVYLNIQKSRIFWILVILGAFIGAIYFNLTFTIDFLNTTTLISLKVNLKTSCFLTKFWFNLWNGETIITGKNCYGWTAEVDMIFVKKKLRDRNFRPQKFTQKSVNCDKTSLWQNNVNALKWPLIAYPI